MARDSRDSARRTSPRRGLAGVAVAAEGLAAGLPAAARADRAARIAARVDTALAEAAAVLAELDDWAQAEPEPGCGDDFALPLEFQLADIERAVDSMLEARDRMLAGETAPPPVLQSR